MNSVFGVVFVALISILIGQSTGTDIFKCYVCKFSNHSGPSIIGQSTDSCVSSPEDTVECPSKKCEIVSQQRKLDTPAPTYSIQRNCLTIAGTAEGYTCFKDTDGHSGVSTETCSCSTNLCNSATTTRLDIFTFPAIVSGLVYLVVSRLF